MKSFLLTGFILFSTQSFAEDKDPLKTFIDKKEQKSQFEESVKNLTKTMNNPKISQQEKLGVLNFFKDSDIEVYKAYVAQETKKEKLDKKEKKAIVEGFSNDSALLAGCEMSYDQKVIYCGDKEYRLARGINEITTRVNTKSDLESSPSGKSVKSGANKQ